MLVYDWMWWGHLTNQKGRGAWRGTRRGVQRGAWRGLPLATINLVGDNREFEV